MMCYIFQEEMIRGPQKLFSQVSDKYTNTVKVKFADRPYMCYIFEKGIWYEDLYSIMELRHYGTSTKGYQEFHEYHEYSEYHENHEYYEYH